MKEDLNCEPNTEILEIESKKLLIYKLLFKNTDSSDYFIINLTENRGLTDGEPKLNTVEPVYGCYSELFIKG